MKKSIKNKIKQAKNEHMLGTPESRLEASLKDEKPARVYIEKK